MDAKQLEIMSPGMRSAFKELSMWSFADLVQMEMYATHQSADLYMKKRTEDADAWYKRFRSVSAEIELRFEAIDKVDAFRRAHKMLSTAPECARGEPPAE